MAVITMKEFLEAGVHFGHQTKRWNPKMKPYIYGARNGIYIIDLQKTLAMFKEAYQFVRDTVARGETVLFVGTKRQSRDAIEEGAKECGMYYVNHRWLGGTLTNFRTIKASIDKLKRYESMKAEGVYDTLVKKEVLRYEREREKLERALGGIKEMSHLPGAVFIVDVKREKIAVAEANRLNIPVVAVVDTNCDPDGIDYLIPGNDDAIRAINLFTSKITNAVMEGASVFERTIQMEGGVVSEDTVPIEREGLSDDVIVEYKSAEKKKPEPEAEVKAPEAPAETAAGAKAETEPAE